MDIKAARPVKGEEHRPWIAANRLKRRADPVEASGKVLRIAKSCVPEDIGNRYPMQL